MPLSLHARSDWLRNRVQGRCSYGSRGRAATPESKADADQMMHERWLTGKRALTARHLTDGLHVAAVMLLSDRAISAPAA